MRTVGLFMQGVGDDALFSGNLFPHPQGGIKLKKALAFASAAADP